MRVRARSQFFSVFGYAIYALRCTCWDPIGTRLQLHVIVFVKTFSSLFSCLLLGCARRKAKGSIQIYYRRINRLNFTFQFSSVVVVVSSVESSRLSSVSCVCF